MIAQKNPSRASATTLQDAEPTNAEKQHPAWHAGFLQMLPSIVRQARRYLRGLAPAAHEEAVLDVLAHAFVAYARLVELGKEDVAYATPLARYSVAQYRAGRRVGMRRNVHDVLSDACRRRHGHSVQRLDRFDATSCEWKEVLVEDRRFGPAEAAATRLDFKAWLQSLTRRNRRLAEKLATGESTSTAARLFGVSGGRVSQLRRELHEAWSLFQSEQAPTTA